MQLHINRYIFCTLEMCLVSFYFDDLRRYTPASLTRKSWRRYALHIDSVTSTRRRISIDGVVVASDRPRQALQTTNTFWIGRPPVGTILTSKVPCAM
jgi:hypothetical protein